MDPSFGTTPMILWCAPSFFFVPIAVKSASQLQKTAVVGTVVPSLWILPARTGRLQL